MLKIKWAVILILCLTFALFGASADLYGTYDKRIKLTAVYTDNITATLTWFPVTVSLTSTQGEEVFVELDEDTDFDKCAFTKADGVTELYADCELYDVSEEVAIYHVSLDGWELSHTANTDFYMYYDDDASPNTGKISASGDTAAQSVYDANFKAVYHMNNQQSLPAFYDTKYEATAEPDADGWTLGGTDYSSVSAGILTLDTSASDSYICYYYKTPDVDFDGGFYMKTYIKASTDMNATTDGLIIQIRDGTQNEQFYMRITNGKVYYMHESDTFTSFVLDTTTAYVTYEIYIKGTTFWIYADGVQKATNTVDSFTTTDLVQFGDTSAVVSYMCKIEMDYLYYALGVGGNPLTTILDSTSNNNDGTKVGYTTESAGKIGQGQTFDGTGDYIDLPTTGLSPSIGTIEICVDKDDSTYRLIYMSASSATNNNRFSLFSQVTTDWYNLQIYDNAGNNQVGIIPEIAAGDWDYVVITYNTNDVHLYIDGADEGSDSSCTMPDAFVAPKLGRYGTGSTHDFVGKMDECRRSVTVRAAAWVKATKESLWDSLLTYGSEETSGVVTTNILFTFENF